MQEIALFSGKIYTVGKNFTRPPVVTVATNLNSAGHKPQTAFEPIFWAGHKPQTAFEQIFWVGHKPQTTFIQLTRLNPEYSIYMKTTNI